MLVEMVIGDAYGAGFEYADADFVHAHNDLAGYVRHPRHAVCPGDYTDDTQMSIAIAEALVSGEPWTPLNLANRFVAAFKRDPREGYARRFYAFLREIEDGAQLLAEIVPSSDKSGAAMRAAPIGVLPDLREVIERAAVQAAITHDTPAGIDAAVAAALMAHYCLYDLGPRRALGDFLATYVNGPWRHPWRGQVASKGWMSVQAAVTAVQACDSLSAMLTMCVGFTGDVDTVASIALAAAAWSGEVAQDLPPALFGALEDGPYGRRFLSELDQQLLSLKGGSHDQQS